jgi:hypothetical protein
MKEFAIAQETWDEEEVKSDPLAFSLDFLPTPTPTP